MITVRIPTPLRSYTEGRKEVPVQGTTVGAVLQDLSESCPTIRPHLFDSEGSLRPYVNIFVNEDDTRSLRGLDTPLDEDDRVMILPSIAGGWAS